MERGGGVGDGDGVWRWWWIGGWVGGHSRGGTLLLLGEFQSVAEDLDSRLFITESTCLGRLTVETEHLPEEPRERHTHTQIYTHTSLRPSGARTRPCPEVVRYVHAPWPAM